MCEVRNHPNLMSVSLLSASCVFGNGGTVCRSMILHQLVDESVLVCFEVPLLHQRHRLFATCRAVFFILPVQCGLVNRGRWLVATEARCSLSAFLSIVVSKTSFTDVE